MANKPICLDTSLFVAYLRGQEPGATAMEQAVRQHECHVTAITVYELRFGAARSKKDIGEDDLLALMKTLAFDESAARRAANLHATLIRDNQEIGVKDVMIAAICLEHKLPILTLNESHFRRVKNLVVITPKTFLR